MYYMEFAKEEVLNEDEPAAAQTSVFALEGHETYETLRITGYCGKKWSSYSHGHWQFPQFY